MLRSHWRVPVVALLGAVLAFMSSFLVSETYQSSTRLIIHGRDADFLSSSGQQDPSQTTITDATSAKALADTYGSVATSRALAISVVDDLDLDAPDRDTGFLHDVAGVLATTYRCVRGFLTAGSCPDVARRDQAINDVQTGTTAQQLGATAGDSAGQPGSYVLEITASGDSPEHAQAITNTLADELVKASTRLVASNARTYIARLRVSLAAARTTVTRKTAAVTAYEQDNNISPTDQELAVSASSYADLKSSLRDAQNDLASDRAELASTRASLAATPATIDSGQTISTGRSDTSIDTNEANPAYTNLLTQQGQTQAAIKGLTVRVGNLSAQVAASSPGVLSARLAGLANLQADLDDARKSQATVQGQLQSAQTDEATAQPDLTRIDTAGRPAYPTSPKRYLYLLIGLLLGGLAGGALTWQAARRAGSGPGDERLDGRADDDPTDLGMSALFGANGHESRDVPFDATPGEGEPVGVASGVHGAVRSPADSNGRHGPLRPDAPGPDGVAGENSTRDDRR